MKARPLPVSALAGILFLANLAAADPSAVKVQNDRVLVTEHLLAPGDTLLFPKNNATMLVYLDDGAVAERSNPAAKPTTNTVHRGEAVFKPPAKDSLPHLLRNAGPAVLRVVTTTLTGNGSPERWGTSGLAPNYKLLLENQYARVYDIRMGAGQSEPLHSHHDRVVICLSGAELQHTLPDGRTETATLKTGEIAWRRAATHVGHNLGKTDLWVIAIEPK